MTSIPDIATEAQKYASLDLHVVQLHGVTNGRCTCYKGKACGKSSGKHPRGGAGWQNRATTDRGEIEEAWKEHPVSNLGIRLGPSSDIVDIEFDSDEGQATSERLLGDIVTPTYRSERLVHRIFEFPKDLDIPKAVATINGLEMRFGTGNKAAQSVFPPSSHLSGATYAWLKGMSIHDIPPAPFPDNIAELLCLPDNGELVLEVAEDCDLTSAPGVEEGRRNAELCRLVGGYLAANGNDASLMTQALAWGQRCSPPYPESEVRETVAAIVQRDNATPSAPEVAVSAPTRKPKLFPYRPFPTEILPEELQRFIEAAASSVSCDESFIALPALAACAAAIGNSIRFAVKANWEEPSLLWTGIVAIPGDKKTPAIAAATLPLLEIQTELQEQYKRDMVEQMQQEQLYKVALNKWKKSPQGVPPMHVEALAEPRTWCDDATVEALAQLLKDNPRGLLLRKDELTAWFKSFGEYKGAGGDLQRWLSIHNTSTVAVDRKTAGPIHVHLPNVSICGGIQPGLLRSFFQGEHVASGLMQRFLFAWPPVKSAMLTQHGIGAQVENAYAAMLRRLQQTAYGGTPGVIPLSRDAWLMFEQWHDYIEQDFKPSVGGGILYEVGSKLVAASVRLAGILNCINDSQAMEIGSESMRLSVTLTRWFLDEWCRCFDKQQEAADTAADRELAEFIVQKHGGSITPHKLASSRRSIADTAEAEALLLKLKVAGWGNFEVVPPGPQGGKPSRVFSVTPGVM